MGGVIAKKPSTAEVLRIDAVQSFDFLGKEFQLLKQKADCTIFQSAFWLDGFYGNLAGNLNAEPVIVIVRSETTGDLLLVLPLVRQSAFGVKIMQPADLGITDYNAVIAHPDTLEFLVDNEGFKEQLQDACKPFDVLFFRKQRPDVFDLGRLLNGADRCVNECSAYDLSMSGSFEDWWQTSLSKSMRKGLARKRRNFCKEIGDLQFRTLYNADEIRRAITFLREERGRRYPGDLLGRSSYFDFYLKIAVEQAESGHAVTFVGEINNDIMTVDFGLCDNNRHLLLLGAYHSNPDYRKYSLGLQGMLELMKTRKAMDINMFDFTIGDEDYKTSFGTLPVALTNVIVTNGIVGKLVLTAYRNDKFVKNFLKRLSPHVN